MARGKKFLFIGLLALVVVAVAATNAFAFFLLSANVDPPSAYPGNKVVINYTVGDPRVPNQGSNGPYEVEIYYCNAPDPNACFECGMASFPSYFPTPGNFAPWHSPELDYSWDDRFQDFHCAGTIQGLIGTASHPGAKMGDAFSMDWTIPNNLTEGKYNIHILVGYSSECLNWTHYTLPFEVLYREEIPNIAVEKTGPTEACQGGTVTYKYDVTNPGTVELENVEVNDDVVGPIYPTTPVVPPPGDTDNDGKLDPGEIWHFEKEYQIPIDWNCANKLINTVTATGSYMGTPVTAQDALEVTVLPKPEIFLEKSGPAEAYEGDTITYIYKVTSSGPLKNVSVVDDKVSPVVYVSGDTNNNQMLEAGEAWMYKADYVVPLCSGTGSSDCGSCQDNCWWDKFSQSWCVYECQPNCPPPSPCPCTITNTATATGWFCGQTKVTAQDNWTVKILCKPTPCPKIAIDKTGQTEAYVGDTITYHYCVTNPGNVALTNIVLTDNVLGIIYPTVPTVLPEGDIDHDNELDPGEKWCFDKQYTIPKCCPNPLVNKATVTGWFCSKQLSASDTHSVRILCKPNVPTSQITNTDGCDLTTMKFKCKSGKVSSTDPGGLIYWVRWNTGSYGGPVNISINSILPSNDFTLWGQNPVKVEVNGVTVYTGKNLSWSGYVSPNSKIVVRVHYKSSLIGKLCSLVKPAYTFSATVNGMNTEDVLLTSK